MPAAVLIPIIISAASTAGQFATSAIMAHNRRKKPIDRGKNDDVRVTGSDYGAFIPRGWGIFRIAGNIIFSNGVQTYTVASTTSGGKKQGGGQAEINYIYKTSVGVLVCRGSITEFRKIWADLKLIYSAASIGSTTIEAEDATLAGGASSTAGTASGGFYVTGLGSGGTATFDLSSVTAQNTADPDENLIFRTRVSFYYKCTTDLDATITTDNGTGVGQPVAITTTFPASTSWTAKTLTFTSVGADTGAFVQSLIFANASGAAPDLDKIAVSNVYQTVGSPANLESYGLTGAVNADIDYPKDLDDPSEYYNYAADASGTGITDVTTPVPGEAIRLYNGTATQTQDAAIVAWLEGKYGVGQGVLRASAHRGLAYMMAADHTLEGGQLENFTFEIDTFETGVNSVIEDLLTDVGLSASDYDLTSTASGYTYVGVLESQAGSRNELLRALCKYYFFRLVERDGKIYTVPDGFTSAVTVTQSQMRAHKYGSEMPKFDAEVVIKEEHLMPREVRVSAMNPDLEFHNETVSARIFADTSATESVDYSFPIIARNTQLRNVAERLLLKEHSEDKTIEFSGMPELAKYCVGDVITIPINGTTHLCRIEKKTMELPLGAIKFQCVKTGYVYTDVVYQDDVTTSLPIQREQFAAQTFPRNSIVFVIPSEPIRDKDKGRLGVYLAISGRGRGNGGKAALYREMDEDNFVLQSIVENMSPVGLCGSALASVADITVEDTTNYVDISFFDDVSLETVLQADIDRNPLVNLIRVGNEWIQFRTAAPQTLDNDSPYRSKWRISNLWRGRFGTTTGHAVDEYAALVTTSLMFYDLDTFDVGQTITLKAVTAGQDIEVAPETTFTFAGNNATGDIETLFDHFTDATTTDTPAQTLWIDQIDAGRLATNGDKITVEYSGIYAANADEKAIYLKFGGTELFSGTGIVENGTRWKMNATIIRVSNTVIRSVVHFETSNPFTPVYTEVTGLNLTTTDYDIELIAADIDNAGDTTAKLGYGLFIPAATAYTADIVFNGEAITFGGEAITFTPGMAETATAANLLQFNAGQVTMFGDSVTFTGA